jgi:hypothetical protein
VDRIGLSRDNGQGRRRATAAIIGRVRDAVSQREAGPAELAPWRRRASLSHAVAVRWRGLLTVAVFVALALWATWPYPLHPFSMLTAPWGGDVASSLATWTTVVHEGDIPFLPGRIDSLNWPAGIQRAPGFAIDTFVSTGFLWIGSLTLGPVAAHGLEALLG